jgi:hypothetical protein
MSRDATPRSRRATRTRQAIQVLGSIVILGVVLSYALAGPAGLLVSLSAVAVAATAAALLGVPEAPARRRRPRKPVPVENAPFRTYRHVAEQLSWAGVSPRHYDVVTRPVLQRLLAVRLADRHGIDLDRSPTAARALVGADLWPWLDPQRSAVGSSRPPGLDQRTLRRLVDRLEEL